MSSVGITSPSGLGWACRGGWRGSLKIPKGGGRNVGPQDQRAKEGLLLGQLMACWTACNFSLGNSRWPPGLGLQQLPGQCLPRAATPRQDRAYRQLLQCPGSLRAGAGEAACPLRRKPSCSLPCPFSPLQMSSVLHGKALLRPRP